MQLHGNEGNIFYDFGDVLSQRLWCGGAAVEAGGGDECDPDEYDGCLGGGVESGGRSGVDPGVGSAGGVGGCGSHE